MAESNDSLVTVAVNPSLQSDLEDPALPEEELKIDKACIPTLIAESTLRDVPPNLQAIIDNLGEIGGSDINKCDLIVSMFYVMMNETGFVPRNFESNESSIDFHKQRLLDCVKLPSNWKNPETQSYCIEFILQPFPNRVCKMLCICLNQNINVNIIIDTTFSCVYQFRILRYIVSEEAAFVPLKFRYLNELSIEFKNNIAIIAKSEILREEEITDSVLQDLPSEILYTIYTYLRIRDFSRLNCTCRRLKECSNYFEDKIWKHYMERDFPDTVDSIVAAADKWKNIYKSEFAKDIQYQGRIMNRQRNMYRNIRFY